MSTQVQLEKVLQLLACLLLLGFLEAFYHGSNFHILQLLPLSKHQLCAKQCAELHMNTTMFKRITRGR